MARFFIDRPIFAWVIAIIIMLAGALSITQLPISRYPTIAPPTVTINAIYPGASAQAVENSVTQVIEQSMTGLDGLLYMSSTSDSNGRVDDHADLRERHRPGHRAGAGAEQAAARHRAAAADRAAAGRHASPRPSAGFLQVRRLRVRRRQHGPRRHLRLRRRRTSSIRSAACPASAACRCSAASTRCASGSTRTSSTPTSCRPTDVIAAIRAQNAQVSVGQLGGTPAIDGQQINATDHRAGPAADAGTVPRHRAAQPTPTAPC